MDSAALAETAPVGFVPGFALMDRRVEGIALKIGEDSFGNQVSREQFLYESSSSMMPSMTDSSVRTSRARLASVALIWLAIPGLLLLPACPSGNGKTGGKAVAGSCDGVRERVESLYKAEQAARAGTDKLDKETRQELVLANTHMVLKDCETDPKRFLPCIERASSAAQLEGECIVRLDDAGKVEDQQFRN